MIIQDLDSTWIIQGLRCLWTLFDIYLCSTLFGQNEFYSKNCYSITRVSLLLFFDKVEKAFKSRDLPGPVSNRLIQFTAHVIFVVLKCEAIFKSGAQIAPFVPIDQSGCAHFLTYLNISCQTPHRDPVHIHSFSGPHETSNREKKRKKRVKRKWRFFEFRTCSIQHSHTRIRLIRYRFFFFSSTKPPGI